MSNSYVASVRVNGHAMGFMLGKGQSTMKALKAKYPDVTIRMKPEGAFSLITLSSVSANRLDACYNEVERQKVAAEAMYDAVMQEKKVLKEKENMRSKIQSANKIRESIESEMIQRHRDGIKRQIIADIGKPPAPAAQDQPSKIVSKNKFAALDLEP